jgi:hypothetical protein
MPSGFQFVTKTVECSQNLDQLDCNSLEGPSEEYLSYYLSSSTFVWSLDTLHFHLAAGDIDGDDPYDELAVTAGGFNWDMHEAFRLIYDKELGDDHTWAAYHNVLNSWFPRPPADVVIADVYPGNGKEEIVFASGWAPGSVLYLDVWGWTADGQPEPIKQYQVGNAGTKYLALGAGDLNTDLTKDIGLLHCTASTCELQTFAYIAGNWQANTTGVIPWAGDSFARLATGNFTGEGLRVGRPNHWVQNKMTTPIAIINMPPKHRDLFKTGEGYISIEIRTQECTDQPDKLNCTHARHKTIDGDTSSTSYTTKNNWQLSQSLSLRLGIVTTSLEGSYGENFERVTKDIAASVFEDSAFAAEFDQLVYDGTNYSVWEYPVYEDDSGVASGLLTVVFPLLNQCQDDFCQPNSPAQRAGNICGEEEGWFLPRHQIFNVWSYPAVGTDFQDYGAYILDKDVTGGGKEFRANMSTIQTNITSTQITKSWGAGVEIHKKADKIPLLGIEIPFEFKSKTSYENQMGELQVEEVTLTDQTEISAYLAALEPGTKFREAASLYWSEMGYLVLDWQTDPIQAEALWGDNYSKPDPAFTLPFYGFPDPDNYQPTPCTDKAWKLYSRDVVVSPPFANAGSTVTASATVRSFSLEDWGDDIGEDPLVVRFYLGDPANNQVLGEGEIDFLARSVGPETVSTTFTIPDVSGKQRIYAVIDPGDAIDTTRTIWRPTEQRCMASTTTRLLACLRWVTLTMWPRSCLRCRHTSISTLSLTARQPPRMPRLWPTTGRKAIPKRPSYPFSCLMIT